MSDALAITEWLLRQPKSYSSGLIVNRPAGGMTHAARLFQARMWRRYAMDWDLPDYRVTGRRAWVEKILRHSRADCIRRARLNLYLARRIRRAKP
jgi:hypothetical protein